MSPAATAWADFAAAEHMLDTALGALDADAILHAAAELHGAAAALAQPGLRIDDERLSDSLRSALKRIESCRLRVMFLADRGSRRVADLTGGGASDRRWRPDRTA
jgi:hypothetical protein